MNEPSWFVLADSLENQSKRAERTEGGAENKPSKKKEKKGNEIKDTVHLYFVSRRKIAGEKWMKRSIYSDVRSRGKLDGHRTSSVSIFIFTYITDGK